jgi:hypothetical protein
MRLFQTAFVSFSVGLFSVADIEDILTTSRRNNRAREITSALLYKKGEILQILEGEREMVLERFKVIEKDPRHRGVTQVYEREIVERDFPGLSMGFDDFTSGEELFYRSGEEVAGHELPWRGFAKPSVAMRLITSFRNRLR